MAKPLWALASGCVPDALPWDIPAIARSGGFLSSGMWVDPKTSWDSTALKKTKKSLLDTGIQLIDVEVVWLDKTDRADDTQKLIVDVGLELKARNLLVVSRHDNFNASIFQFREICERAGEDLRVCLEFGEFTSIKSLSKAREFIDLVDHPTAGILIDLMHLNRSGDILPDLNSPLFPYIQGCDFWQNSSTMTGMDYIKAAVDSRCCLGEGEARINDINLMCRSKKDISLEIRSTDLREKYPDPFKRAKAIFEGCNRNLYI
jgi:sugar phosphate isomerase/epimerase